MPGVGGSVLMEFMIKTQKHLGREGGGREGGKDETSQVVVYDTEPR